MFWRKCADSSDMTFVLSAVGLLLLLSVVALARAIRGARDGYEDKGGFHFSTEVSAANWTGKSLPPIRPTRVVVKRTAPKQAA